MQQHLHDNEKVSEEFREPLSPSSSSISSVRLELSTRRRPLRGPDAQTARPTNIGQRQKELATSQFCTRRLEINVYPVPDFLSSTSASQEYRDLCEIYTKKVQLDDSEYEYQPPQYYEVYCKNYPLNGNDRATEKTKQECVNPGFHCVQRSKTLFLVRRRWDSECWEPYAREIASGCDCMWPVSALGDIAVHY
ncbi:uncharacterized protein LOC143218881 isoform X4 [Lasioglossum baleicum]